MTSSRLWPSSSSASPLAVATSVIATTAFGCIGGAFAAVVVATLLLLHRRFVSTSAFSGGVSNQFFYFCFSLLVALGCLRHHGGLMRTPPRIQRRKVMPTSLLHSPSVLSQRLTLGAPFEQGFFQVACALYQESVAFASPSFNAYPPIPSPPTPPSPDIQNPALKVPLPSPCVSLRQCLALNAVAVKQ